MKLFYSGEKLEMEKMEEEFLNEGKESLQDHDKLCTFSTFEYNIMCSSVINGAVQNIVTVV